MSAYIVDRKHIEYLVRAMHSRRIAGINHRYEPAETLALEANMLAAATAASVNCRYSETEAADTWEARDFHGASPWLEINPVELLKAIACYEYQSCEHGGWEGSRAYAYCERLRQRAINALHGYDAAPWGAPPTTAEKYSLLKR